MELFSTAEGSACYTCKQAIDATPVQEATARAYENKMAFYRKRLDGHGGH